jgi:hypothetical protein
MKLLLKETIRAGGVRHLPKSIVDTKVIGITDADADVLVRRGTATVVHGEAAEVAEVKQPEVTEPEAAAEVQAAEVMHEVTEPEPVVVDGEPVAEAKPEPVAKPAAKTAAKSKK